MQNYSNIKMLILDVDGVSTLHILRTRQMGSEALVDVHIQVDPKISVSEGHYISETVRSKLIKEIEEVSDVMVHIDPEDDEIAPLSTRLPLRRDILQKLDKAWAGLEEAKQIQNITLHYLQGKIEIELLLPLAILHNAQPDAGKEVKQRFQQALAEVDEISSVNVCFQ